MIAPISIASKRKGSICFVFIGFFVGVIMFFLLKGQCGSETVKIYKDENGVIHLTDAPPKSEKSSLNTKRYLLDKYAPKNVIEVARLAVVQVISPFGTGSGFFISEDGYIITNKHVIDESWENINKKENQIEKQKKIKEIIEGRIELEEKRLNKEKGWLEWAENQIEQVKQYLSSPSVNDPNLEERYEVFRLTYQKRSKQYELDIEELNIYKEDFKYGTKILDKEIEKFDDRVIQKLSKTPIKIVMIDGTRHNAHLIYKSRENDIALLRTYGIKPVHLTTTLFDDYEIGQQVFAIGHPLGLKTSVTSGVVSSYHDGYIQTNAQINFGNSGGPLVLNTGHVIGINTIKAVGFGVEGIGYAIPISIALKELEDYLK